MHVANQLLIRLGLATGLLATALAGTASAATTNSPDIASTLTANCMEGDYPGGTVNGTVYNGEFGTYYFQNSNIMAQNQGGSLVFNVGSSLWCQRDTSVIPMLDNPTLPLTYSQASASSPMTLSGYHFSNPMIHTIFYDTYPEEVDWIDITSQAPSYSVTFTASNTAEANALSKLYSDLQKAKSTNSKVTAYNNFFFAWYNAGA